MRIIPLSSPCGPAGWAGRSGQGRQERTWLAETGRAGRSGQGWQEQTGLAEAGKAGRAGRNGQDWQGWQERAGLAGVSRAGRADRAGRAGRADRAGRVGRSGQGGCQPVRVLPSAVRRPAMHRSPGPARVLILQLPPPAPASSPQQPRLTSGAISSAREEISVPQGAVGTLLKWPPKEMGPHTQEVSQNVADRSTEAGARMLRASTSSSKTALARTQGSWWCLSRYVCGFAGS